jgi:hypothetical protein
MIDFDDRGIMACQCFLSLDGTRWMNYTTFHAWPQRPNRAPARHPRPTGTDCPGGSSTAEPNPAPETEPELVESDPVLDDLEEYSLASDDNYDFEFLI